MARSTIMSSFMRSLNALPSVLEAPPADTGAAKLPITAQRDVRAAVAGTMQSRRPETILQEQSATWTLSTAPSFDDPFARWIQTLPPQAARAVAEILEQKPEQDPEKRTGPVLMKSENFHEQKALEQWFLRFCGDQLGFALASKSPQMQAAVLESVFGPNREAHIASAKERAQPNEKTIIVTANDAMNDYKKQLDAMAKRLVMDHIRKFVIERFTIQPRALVRSSTLDAAEALQDICSSIVVLAGNRHAADRMRERAPRGTHALMERVPAPGDKRDVIVIDGMTKGVIDAKDCNELIRRCLDELSPQGLIFLLQPDFGRRSVMDLQIGAGDRGTEPAFGNYSPAIEQRGLGVMPIEANLVLKAETPAAFARLGTLVYGHVPAEQRMPNYQPLIERVESEASRNHGNFIYPLTVIAAGRGIVDTKKRVVPPTPAAKATTPAKPKIDVPALPKDYTAAQLHAFVLAANEASENGANQYILDGLLEKEGRRMPLVTFSMLNMQMKSLMEAATNPATKDKSYVIQRVRVPRADLTELSADDEDSGERILTRKSRDEFSDVPADLRRMPVIKKETDKPVALEGDEAAEYAELNAFMETIPVEPGMRRVFSVDQKRRIVRFFDLHKKRGLQDFVAKTRSYRLDPQSIRNWKAELNGEAADPGAEVEVIEPPAAQAGPFAALPDTKKPKANLEDEVIVRDLNIIQERLTTPYTKVPLTFRAKIRATLQRLLAAGRRSTHDTLRESVLKVYPQANGWFNADDIDSPATTHSLENQEYADLLAFMNSLEKLRRGRHRVFSAEQKTKIVRFFELHQTRGSKDTDAAMHSYGITYNMLQKWKAQASAEVTEPIQSSAAPLIDLVINTIHGWRQQSGGVSHAIQKGIVLLRRHLSESTFIAQMTHWGISEEQLEKMEKRFGAMKDEDLVPEICKKQ